MSKNVKIVLGVVLGIMIIAVGVYAIFSGNDNEKADQNVQEVSGQVINTEETQKTQEPDKGSESAPASKEEGKTVTPTFMYFIGNEDVKTTNKVLERLKNEYGEKVVFDIRNVDDNPELLDNFPVEGATPALIMLNTKNDISAFLFDNAEYDDLKTAIEEALK